MIKKKKAMALMVAYTLLTALMVTASAQVKTVTTDYSASYRTLNNEKAFWLAEAGLSRARHAIANSEWTGWTISGNDYKLSVDNHVGEVVVKAEKVGNAFALASTGFVAGLAGEHTFSKALEQKGDITSPFSFAAFGKYSFLMNGSAATNSYDSSIGRYNVGGNLGSEGDVGTNATILTLSGSPMVNGDVKVGPNGEVIEHGTGSEDIHYYSGTVSDNSQEDFQTATVPESLKSMASGGNFKQTWATRDMTLGGNLHYNNLTVTSDHVLNLQAGTKLYVSGTFKVTGAAALNILGDVEIYVDGDISIAGSGIVNVTQRPTNLLLYGTGTDSSRQQKVTVSGDSDFYGAIYAPESDISVPGSAEVYGSMIGGDVKLTGDGDIHYDESLGRMPTDLGSYKFSSWAES